MVVKFILILALCYGGFNPLPDDKNFGLVQIGTTCRRHNHKPFPKLQILESSKLKEFADDNFKFDEDDRKFSKQITKHCGKRRNCLLQAISPFPTVFSKDLYCRHVWERVTVHLKWKISTI